MSEHPFPLPGTLEDLAALLPELEALRTVVETSDWHAESVYDQSVRLFGWVRRLPDALREVADVPLESWADALGARLDPEQGCHSVQHLLGFAALIHDVGKAQTLTRQPNGSTRCPDHEAIGAQQAETICDRFALSEGECRFVIDLVRSHGEPYALYKRLAPLSEAQRRARVEQLVTRHATDAMPLLLLAVGDLVTSQLSSRRPPKYAGILDFYRSLLAALSVPLDRPGVRQTISKNAAISYGLTLAVRLPHPSEVTARIATLQGHIETLLPERFAWYGAEQLHATLVAPLRGRYRTAPPLQRAELPDDLETFVRDLCDLFAARPPFRLELGGASLAKSGLLLVGERTLVRELAACFERYPELDPPKRVHGLHVTIGYLKTLLPFDDAEQKHAFDRAMHELRDLPLGAVDVDRVWLVHYANRTLAEVVGQVPLPLGRDAGLNARDVLEQLGISP